MPVAMIDDQMQTETVIRNADHPSRFGPWLWIVFGGSLLLFSYGANNIPIAAWLSPVFLLRFARRQKWRVWIPVVYILQVVAIAFQFRGMTLESGIDYYAFLAVGAIVALGPYAADRWLAVRVGGLASTLVFPCAWTMLDYLNSFGPYGSWGAAAYSQSGDLPLLQLISVTGFVGHDLPHRLVRCCRGLPLAKGMDFR